MLIYDQSNVVNCRQWDCFRFLYLFIFKNIQIEYICFLGRIKFNYDLFLIVKNG